MSRNASTHRFQVKPSALAISVLFSTMGLTFAATTLAQTAADISPDAYRYKPVLVDPNAGAASASLVMMDGLYVANAKVGQIKMQLEAPSITADGVTAAKVTLTVFDKRGELLKEPVLVTIENSGGRLQMQGASTDEFGPTRKDADRRVPGTQIKVVDGTTSFSLIAPSQPEDVKLRLSAGSAEVSGVVSYMPDLREMIASGLIEGVLRLDKRNYGSTISPARMDDGFEQELTQWSRNFNGDKTLAARAAMFLKGKISGDMLLTMAYDSDKETRARLLRDIRPEEFYPVYGDGSTKAFDAQSSSKLYVRVDKNRSFVMYGDFSTGAGFAQSAGGGVVTGSNLRQLGAYNRTVTGIRAHGENATGFVNAFVSRDTLKQVTEELRANGTSGPFAVSNTSAVENSEKIEIIVWDRNNLNKILSITPLVRLNDYSFEPFSSRILLARPVPSQDINGNPMSLRITYEVDQGGKAYLMAGVDGQVNIGDTVTLGGVIVEDKNPIAPFRLAAINAGVKVADKTTLIAEIAQTTAGTLASPVALPALSSGTVSTTTGRAARIEVVHAGETVQGKLYANKTDADFANASGGAQAGTQQLGGKVNVNVNTDLGVNAEAQRTTDTSTDAQRTNVGVGVSYKVNEALNVNAGIRSTQETGRVSGATSSIGANPAPGSYFAPGSTGGFSGANSATLLNLNNAGAAPSVAPGTAGAPDLKTTTLVLGAGLKVTDKFTLSGQVEVGSSSDQTAGLKSTVRNFEVMGTYQIAERARLYARYANQNGLSSQYAYDTANKSSALSFGIDANYMEGGNVFSEYRLRDATTSREAQIATGVRNAWHIADGVTLTTGLERLKIFSGAGQNATAATVGLDYTASELWKASTRLEWRRLDKNASTPGAQDTILSTVTVARKLDRDWTLLGRNYFLATNNPGAPELNGRQDRFQVGFAYRPVDTNRFDALGKIEFKTERNINAANESRRATVASLQTNWHPQRPFWLSGRAAFKNVNETYPSTEGGANDAYKAYLLGGRAIYDITENWDLGLMAAVMSGKSANQSGSSVQKAWGVEVGYQMASNLWASLGYNWAGFTDRDLSSDYTARGMYVRLRYKFDQDLFESNNPLVNRALPR